MIITLWIFSTCWSVLGIFRWKTKTNSPDKTFSISVKRMCVNENHIFFVVSFCGIFVPVLIIMTCTYIRILHIALTQIRKTERSTTIISVSSSSSQTDQNCEKRRRRSSKVNLVIRELKATKSIATVYVAFCVCWLPSCVFHLILLSTKGFHLSKTLWFIFIDILPVVSTSVNPFIYAFLNKEFRNAVQYIWRKLLVQTKLRDSYLTRKQTDRMAYVCSHASTLSIIDTGIISTAADNGTEMKINKSGL